MAEIVVRAKYDDLTQRWLLLFLRITFPLWGLLLPIAFVLMLCIGACFANYYLQHEHKTLAELISILFAAPALPYVGFTLCSMVIPVGGLALMRTLSKNNLLLEKNGIALPVVSFQWQSRRFIPWSKITKVQVYTDSKEPGWQSRTIVFFKGDGSSDKLRLGNFQSSELEQVIVAIETWGTGAEIDQSVRDLQKELRKEQTQQIGMSYTDMWEDELRRRYNPTAFMPLDPGIFLHDGKLKVIRQLATGGLSAIYLAQLEDQKLAVLKEAVLPEDASETVRAKASELFAREAQLLAKIDHPNIVKVMEYFVEDGRHYMLMDYIPGQDLRQFIRQNGAQRETIVVDWGIQIVNIMKYLHELDPPIIHRDLTPDNLVLRDDGNIVLIDFGAANEFISKGTGTFVGKQSFIAPEQFRGKAVLQSDIYALGCTLFFLLTGQEPEALDCSSPRQMNENISPELDELVQCCTQLDAKDRFQSAAQLLPVLRKIAASLLGVV